jgi:hypothetical protein
VSLILLNSLFSGPVFYVVMGILGVLAFVFLVLGIIYLTDTVLIKHKISKIDLIVVFLIIAVPTYSAIMAKFSFDQKIIQSIKSSLATNLSLVSLFGIQMLIKSEKLSLKGFYNILQVFCWLVLGIYFYLYLTMDPRLLVDTQYVSYNAAKGGYAWRFPTSYIELGIVFYFLHFMMKKNILSLVAWTAFMAYLMFINKGRITIFSVSIAMAFAMFTSMGVKDIVKRFTVFLVLVGIMVGALYAVRPDLLNVLYTMMKAFALSLLGFETGDNAADSRWVQIGKVLDYYSKYPEYIFTGIGRIDFEVFQAYFGRLYITDIGIVGVFFTYGIFGIVVYYSLFAYAFYLIYKIKHLKRDFYFRVTFALIVSQFVSSFFTGSFVWVTIDLLIIMVILQKVYTIERNMVLNNKIIPLSS